MQTAAIALATGLVALVLGILWGGHPQSLPGFLRDNLVQDEVATRAEVAKDIHDNFYKPVKDKRLEEASIKGMVGALHDRFSQYFTPSEARAFTQNLSGKFEGVGMSVNSRDTKRGLRVARVFDGSPAKAAGIRTGDLIVAVNGKSIVGQSADVATGKIRGPAGTKVTLTIRSGKAKPRTVTLERRKLDVPLVEGRIVTRGGKKLAHVRLAEFARGSHGQLRAEIDKDLKRGAKGILLDLRANPGGTIDEAVLAASSFLQKGQPVVPRRGRRQREHRDDEVGGEIDPRVQVVVLVDGTSASGGEVVAGALRD